MPREIVEADCRRVAGKRTLRPWTPPQYLPPPLPCLRAMRPIAPSSPTATGGAATAARPCTYMRGLRTRSCPPELDPGSKPRSWQRRSVTFETRFVRSCRKSKMKRLNALPSGSPRISRCDCRENVACATPPGRSFDCASSTIVSICTAPKVTIRHRTLRLC